MTLPVTQLVDSSAMTAGDVVESGDNRIVSRRLEGNVTLKGGELAIYGTDPATQCRRVSAATAIAHAADEPSVVAGVAVNDPNRRGDANGRTQYVQDDAVGILQRGAVAVVAGAAVDVSAAKDVFVNVQTGAFYSADDGANRVKVVNAQCRSDVATGSVGVIEVDGPVFEVAIA